jgi:hypothetical protein
LVRSLPPASNDASNRVAHLGVRRTWGGLRLILRSDQGTPIKTKAVTVSVLSDAVPREAFAEASRLRGEFYECLTARCDELFELVDAVLCAEGALRSPVD